MGLEKEKAETCVFMDEDVFHSTIEPILKKEKERESARAPPLHRDPRDINAHLKVDFEDLIGEPSSIHSLDSVWIGSHALFELIKFVFYRVLTTLLAIPMAFVAGLVFAILSCIHIWVLMPLVQSCMLMLPSIQVMWSSLMDTFLRPVFLSASSCLSSINVKTCKPDVL
ncbi:caveolin-2 [Neoarius graeffei]|uniref:caveolin-2 n=1 Tax=Neoarius graeffei TaxID=443677 RepID=UPI00298D33A2|nr:caveolin-2 [Neoarius graeffei]